MCLATDGNIALQLRNGSTHSTCTVYVWQPAEDCGGHHFNDNNSLKQTIMFSALRQNSLVYILDKKDTPILRKGTVLSVTAPRAKTQGLYSNPLDMVVDINIKVSDTQETLKNIPANLSIANDGTMVISETREAMCSEVESMLASSRQMVESVPYHKKVIETCDAMLKELNPQFAKEKQQEEKISALEAKIGGIETSIGDMKQMLA